MKKHLWIVFLLLLLLLTGCGQGQDSSVITLTDARVAKGAYDTFGFAIDQDYLYYQGQQGEIYQRPLSALTDNAQRKTMMTVDIDSVTDDYVIARLYEEAGRIYLNYYSGGATMGSNHQYLLKEDGTAKEIGSGKFSYYDFGDFQVTAPEFVPPEPAKLEYADKNGERLIGEDDYFYRAAIPDGGSSFSFGSACVSAWGDNLYTVGFKPQWGGRSEICQINLATGKTRSISQYPAEQFQLADGLICYRYQGNLYVFNIPSNSQYKIVDEASALYTLVDNGVYYYDAVNNRLNFWNKQKDSVNAIETVLENCRVERLYQQNGYAIVHTAESYKKDAQLLVFAPSGEKMEQVYAADVCSDRAVINADGVLVYRLMGSNQLVKVQL